MKLLLLNRLRLRRNRLIRWFLRLLRLYISPLLRPLLPLRHCSGCKGKIDTDRRDRSERRASKQQHDTEQADMQT
ncbi:hypothetical protein [Geobacter lovleyi]|uniref:hypothetical protein n=1 Tax=Trichlorobacter lovleyi TaxID=313985 RepID=UPI00059E8FD4